MNFFLAILKTFAGKQIKFEPSIITRGEDDFMEAELWQVEMHN